MKSSNRILTNRSCTRCIGGQMYYYVDDDELQCINCGHHEPLFPELDRNRRDTSKAHYRKNAVRIDPETARVIKSVYPKVSIRDLTRRTGYDWRVISRIVNNGGNK